MPEAAGVSAYLLGFDFGHKRIGIAVGQTLTRGATALRTVASGREPDWGSIMALIAEWKPARLVVGLPLGAEGEETDISRDARRFGNELAERSGLEVCYMDERLTSRQAEARFAELRAEGRARRRDSRLLDAMAAQIILENWLHAANDGG